MNKKLKEVSKEDIAKAYENKTPLAISNLRYRVYKQQDNIFFDMYTGEIISRNGFNRYVAQKYDKGFEFRVYESNKQRKTRLKARVSRILRSNNAKFLTLTFNDEFFERETSEETRRRYIARFLKEQCKEYVANIDYGESEDKTHREHYHAIVVPKKANIDYKPYTAIFNKSRIYSENIIPTDRSKKYLSLYINKLTNHSLKSSGQYKRLIYSRKSPLH